MYVILDYCFIGLDNGFEYQYVVNEKDNSLFHNLDETFNALIYSNVILESSFIEEMFLHLKTLSYTNFYTRRLNWYRSVINLSSSDEDIIKEMGFPLISKNKLNELRALLREENIKKVLD